VIRKLKASKKRIKYLNNEMDKRLRDSKQFQQLQKLMQGKNKELVDLRDRLVRYEPEGIEEDEDI
jgi:predicted  nucleic acid-binding Zn-ribbon protein